MSAFIDQGRDRYGVEPICRTLGVSASAYYERATGQRSARAVEDERLLARIGELHAANYHAYGYRRMWKALLRAGERVSRCPVQRLMRRAGIQCPRRRRISCDPSKRPVAATGWTHGAGADRHSLGSSARRRQLEQE